MPESLPGRRSALRLLAAGATLAALPRGGAEARPLEQVLSTKKLRVGINPTLPPFGLFNERNQIDGFDADVARELARLLKVELEIVQVGSPDRVPFVQADRVDLVMGSITRTVDRALVIDFTMPLHSQSMVVLAREGTSVPLNKPADLNNKDVKLVQVRGTTGIPWIQANAPLAQVTLLDNYPDVFRALAQGRADALVDVYESVLIPMRNQPDVKWRVLDQVLGTMWTGIGVQKGNASLRDAVNVALFDMHARGFVNQAWEKWFGGPMRTPVPLNPMF
ncbi:transporter substrate-binding domain-containing protein [Roseomonas sp. GC11]|uniref:transporter substrate-binding domain-containing protein n=1 Tax=Roseomonas sp. GC11 TaxID=2950546 RepID=UPI00210C6FF4|nr:transporter substrate-binding domain-containing protein [Roseomonas sp. GC11]MCQ4159504.1 transporter substrate-binding domain-containing protein [Roseomonas sp. GC11]